MSRKFEHGIGRVTRSEWAGDRMPTVPEQQMLSLQVGIVMDDQDDHKMGRIWVYLPGSSSERFDANAYPRYGGTTPDRQDGTLKFDQNLRVGWILCYPLMPFFGSDDFRVTRSSEDNRNAKQGDVISYGLWFQPRIGDHVAVFFNSADPGQAFWFGCLPKYYRNFMVPGSPGVTKQEIVNPDVDSGKDAIIPALDKVDTGTTSDTIKRYKSGEFTTNLVLAGVSSDPYRGAGYSSARRESPSYITGIKSPGWSFDSEKYNINISGKQFIKDAPKYGGTNSTGHQFIMDDHPDNQMVRIRTSNGSQILFNDSHKNSIYIQTAKGNVWIEMTDDGTLNIYSKDSVSIHSTKDINLTSSGDINLESENNMNLYSRNDFRLTVDGEMHWAIGTKNNNAYLKFFGDLNTIVDGQQINKIAKGKVENIGEGLILTTEEDISISAKGDYRSSIEGSYNLAVTENIKIATEGDMALTISGTYHEQASLTFMNSGAGEQPDPPNEDNTTEIEITPKFQELNKVPSPPTSSEIKTGKKPTGEKQHLAPTVPQHQPWSENNSKISKAPVSNCDTSNINSNFRKGAVTADATKPLDYVGVKDEKSGSESDDLGFWEGNPFKTTSISEDPSYTLSRLVRPTEVGTFNTFSVSDTVTELMRADKVFSNKPYQDENGTWKIGWDTEMYPGMKINGITLDQNVFNSLNRNFGNVPSLYVDDESAKSLLQAQANAIAAKYAATAGETKITQDQYDSSIAYAANAPSSLQGPRISQIIEDLNKKRNGTLRTKVLQDSKNKDGSVNCRSLSNNRNNAKGFTGAKNLSGNGCTPSYTDDSGTKFTADFGNAGKFNITNSVNSAICNASKTYGIPYDYMMAMAAQESGFNPLANQNCSSRAKGLFQFFKQAWVQTGNSADSFNGDAPYDPVLNSNAAAQYSLISKKALEANGFEVNATNLYTLHFLGPGGGIQFLKGLRDNPSAASSSYVSSAAINGNSAIFGTGSRSLESVYSQLYNFVGRRANIISNNYMSNCS